MVHKLSILEIIALCISYVFRVNLTTDGASVPTSIHQLRLVPVSSIVNIDIEVKANHGTHNP